MFTSPVTVPTVVVASKTLVASIVIGPLRCGSLLDAVPVNVASVTWIESPLAAVQV
jgi:hypothetical protein